jgi:hypothetical protein
MGVSTAIRRSLVESPRSLGARARARRWQLIGELFPDLGRLRVVDLGGTVEAWQRAPLRPAHVTVLNLFEPGKSDAKWVTAVVGDACEPDDALASATGGAEFDLVFSNSLLEHVGGHANRQKVAEAVRRLAPRHWVQTPYRYFPLEPHWLFPGMQWLPVAARARIAATWPLSHNGRQSLEAARRSVLWTELVGIAEMREYFPDSEIVHERVAGLTKSLVAVTR